MAAWFYTGGKHPYGYYGLGELFVFVFFGLVATAGSAYVQALTVNLEAWLGGVGAGLIACAVLMANNLRDVAQDKASGKRTLAVLVGPLAGRILFAVFMLVPFAIAVFFALLYPTAWLVLFGLLLALPASIIVLWAKTPRELLLALQLASFTALVYGIGLGLAFALLRVVRSRSRGASNDGCRGSRLGVVAALAPVRVDGRVLLLVVVRATGVSRRRAA